MIKPLPKLENWYVCQCSMVYMGPEAVLVMSFSDTLMSDKSHFVLLYKELILESFKENICIQSSGWALVLRPKIS